jgi:hypothetical protein
MPYFITWCLGDGYKLSLPGGSCTLWSLTRRGAQRFARLDTAYTMGGASISRWGAKLARLGEGIHLGPSRGGAVRGLHAWLQRAL